jgi:hypothetical protein
MSVIVVNLPPINKGTDFEFEFQIFDENNTAINLTGCEILSKIRKHPASSKFNTFTTAITNTSRGIFKLIMSNKITSVLSGGRNCYDVFVKYPNQKIKKVVEGSVLVNNSATYGRMDSKQLDSLGSVDTTNLADGEVLMYIEQDQKLDFVNPDDVLDKSAEDGLPVPFIEEVKTELENRFDIDMGEY